MKKTATQIFQDDYAKEWAKLTSKPVFAAFLDMLRENSPIEQAAFRVPGDIVVGGHVLFAEIQGFQRCFNLIRTIPTAAVSDEELPSDYKTN